MTMNTENEWVWSTLETNRACRISTRGTWLLDRNSKLHTNAIIIFNPYYLLSL